MADGNAMAVCHESPWPYAMEAHGPWQGHDGSWQGHGIAMGRSNNICLCLKRGGINQHEGSSTVVQGSTLSVLP